MSDITLCVLLYSDWWKVKKLFETLIGQEKYINQIIISSDNPDNINIHEIKKIINNFNLTCKIILRENNNNLGPVEHVKILLKIVNTKFIMFSGGDDYFHLDYFLNVTNFLAEGYSAITPLHYRVNELGNIVGKSSCSSDLKVNKRHLNEIIEKERFPIPSPGTVYRVSDLNRVEYIDGIINEDDQFLLSCIINGGWKIIPLPLFFYRVSSSSLSSWHRKPFIKNSILKKYLLLEYINRKSQNLCWNMLIEKSNIHNKKVLIDICLNNIKKYENKIIKIESNNYYYFIFSHRFNALLKLITLLVKSIIYKIIKCPN